jgi:hypothetical protein
LDQVSSLEINSKLKSETKKSIKDREDIIKLPSFTQPRQPEQQSMMNNFSAEVLGNQVDPKKFSSI